MLPQDILYDADFQANIYQGMVGKSEKMHREVFRKIDEVAKTGVTVLILGETGTGKELAAKAIHNLSDRHRNKYNPIDCGAFNEGLLESELFGHVKGAYTGATDKKDGMFVSTDGGTLYLDEIGNMSREVQSRLMRVLEYQTIKPLGSDNTRDINVRIIAGTNMNIRAAVSEGKFKEDLYYRLSAVIIDIPPLRSRLGDVPMLINYFMNKYQKDYQRKVDEFTPKEYVAYMRYRWPGNVRELENAVRRVISLREDKLKVLEDMKEESSMIRKDIPQSTYSVPSIRLPTFASNNGGQTTLIQDSDKVKEQYEMVVILRTLEETLWNRKETARRIGMSYKGLRNKLKKWHLTPLTRHEIAARLSQLNT